MSGIQTLAEDACRLWDSGRRESGILLALCAVAARARQDYPSRRFGEQDAFGQFIRSRFAPRLSIEFCGELHALEHIFYKWMRCELVHTGGLPPNVRFKEDAEPGELSVRAGGAPHYVLLFSPSWFDQLIAWATS